MRFVPRIISAGGPNQNASRIPVQPHRVYSCRYDSWLQRVYREGGGLIKPTILEPGCQGGYVAAISLPCNLVRYLATINMGFCLYQCGVAALLV